MGSSSITGDETIGFFDNMSFDGTARGGKMTTDGELWIGSTAAPHVVKGSLTAGTGVSIINGSGSITIATAGSVPTTFTGDTGSATPFSNNLNVLGGMNIAVTGAGSTLTIDATGAAGFTWVDVTGTSQAMAVNTGYVANNGSLVTLTLPSTAAFGEIMKVAGKGAGGWKIAQNASQVIHFGTVDTTTGVGGSLASTNRYDVIEVLCIVADLEFLVLSPGNITVT